jgi:hypothetical protein
MLVNVDYYCKHGFCTGGESPEELERYLLNAERKVNIVTLGKCNESDKLPQDDFERLKQAICCQAEDEMYYKEPEFKMKIGDFSYENNNPYNERKAQTIVSPLAYGILKFSGLISIKAEAR